MQKVFSIINFFLGAKRSLQIKITLTKLLLFISKLFYLGIEESGRTTFPRERGNTCGTTATNTSDNLGENFIFDLKRSGLLISVPAVLTSEGRHVIILAPHMNFFLAPHLILSKCVWRQRGVIAIIQTI